LTHARRSLLRTPVFAIGAALTLALGIGSVASAFAIVYGVLLDPLPFGNPDRLVSDGLGSAELRRIQQRPGVCLTHKRFARRIEDIGFYRTGNANIAATGGVAEAQRVTAAWGSWADWSSRSRSDAPSALGMTQHIWPAASPKSKSAGMCGCVSRGEVDLAQEGLAAEGLG
jgi:hypothetical protein